jgi:uncharacterized alpha-E superfamily protein
MALGFLPDGFANTSLAEKRWRVDKVLSGLVYDPGRTSSIGWNLKNIRRVTWPLKERLSQDTWRVLQQLETEFSQTLPFNPGARLATQMNLLDQAIVTLSAFAGLLMENTTRGPGWHFLDIGKRLERALQTADLLLASLAHGPFEFEPSLETLLQIADSSITYRTRYFTTLRIEFVLELLLADEGNPRSLSFQLATLAIHMRNLPGYDDQGELPLPLQLAEKALASIRTHAMDDLAAPNAQGNIPLLEDVLQKLKGNLYDISDALTARHFSHLTSSRLVVPT